MFRCACKKKKEVITLPDFKTYPKITKNKSNQGGERLIHGKL